MKRISLFVMVVLCLLIYNSSCFAESLPEKFIKVVQLLERYALEKDINLERDEDIKDVVTLGYLNAINGLDVPFGYLDEEVKRATVDWLSILCWFPLVPPDKKKTAEKELKEIRRALAQNSYERTLASISLMPGFAVTSVGEVFTPSQMMHYFPDSTRSMEIYNYLEEKKYSPAFIINSLQEDKIEYKDLVISEWIEKYLR